MVDSVGNGHLCQDGSQLARSGYRMRQEWCQHLRFTGATHHFITAEVIKQPQKFDADLPCTAFVEVSVLSWGLPHLASSRHESISLHQFHKAKNNSSMVRKTAFSSISGAFPSRFPAFWPCRVLLHVFHCSLQAQDLDLGFLAHPVGDPISGIRWDK